MYELNEEEFKRKLQKFLREYMKDNNLSQREFASLTNLSESSIKNFCCGKTMPTLDGVYNIMMSIHVNLYLELDLPTAASIHSANKEKIDQMIDEDLHTLEMIRESIK